MACGPDITLSLPAASASQGGLLLAELVARMSLSDVQMRFDGEEIPSWGVGGSDRSERKLWAWHGLVAVDLEKAAGDYALVLTALQASGEKISCELGVHVTAGKFPTESLKVAPQFVEPNPEQLERAKSEQRRLREIYATRTAEKLWHGKFRAPLDGVTSGANFGRRRVLNGEPSSPHTGVDFPAPTGTPVHAAQAGRVVLAEPLYFSGNTVLIDHGLGVYTLYGHLSQIAVTAGDKLSTGAVLGKVGATGRVTGPHLHWGLTVNRAHVNALGIVNLTGD
jgi:murein DD-endopeptidase MepM/ murein hydrolase activator NlpD